MARLQMSPQVALWVDGRTLMNPPSLRKRYTSSHLVIEPDGSTVPLLWIIAEKLFGAWDQALDGYPYWKDMNCYNASETNVGFSKKRIDPIKRKPSQYGPSGTPEYFRAYYEATREKRKKYQRERYHEGRAAVKRLQDGLQSEHISTEKAEGLQGMLDNVITPEQQERLLRQIEEERKTAAESRRDPTGSNMVEK
jgi:hypothetical protein